MQKKKMYFVEESRIFWISGDWFWVAEFRVRGARGIDIALSLFFNNRVLSDDLIYASGSHSMLCRLYCSCFCRRTHRTPSSFLLHCSFESLAVSYPTITCHFTPVQTVAVHCLPRSASSSLFSDMCRVFDRHRGA